MKIEKMANIVLTEDEIKSAVLFGLKYDKKIFNHLSKNHWVIDVNDKGEFVICVDGIMEVEEV